MQPKRASRPQHTGAIVFAMSSHVDSTTVLCTRDAETGPSEMLPQSGDGISIATMTTADAELQPSMPVEIAQPGQIADALSSDREDGRVWPPAYGPSSASLIGLGLPCPIPQTQQREAASNSSDTYGGGKLDKDSDSEDGQPWPQAYGPSAAASSSVSLQPVVPSLQHQAAASSSSGRGTAHGTSTPVA